MQEGPQPAYGPFPLFPDTVAQPAAYPGIQILKLLAPSGMLEVVDPAPHEAVQFFNAFLYCLRRGLAGDFPDLPLELLPTFTGYFQLIFAPHRRPG